MARAKFPQCDEITVREIVARALLLKGAQDWPLSWIGDLETDALMLAQEDGRKSILPRDVERALKELREPSDLAQVSALSAPQPKPSGRGVSAKPQRADAVAFEEVPRTTERNGGGQDFGSVGVSRIPELNEA